MRDEPPAFLSDPALRTLLQVLPGARVVGGAVRDALARRPVADVDVATPWTPDAVARALADAGLRSAPTGLDHGTLTAVVGGRGFEVTTLRRDVETDGRHARVVFTDDWAEDAARRDFTINAMSMTPDGELFDYFGGVADLAAGRVRFVGDAAARVAEDRLRILRFFRFQARYGVGEPDAAAVAAIRAAAGDLSQLSPERVWSELSRILAAPRPEASLTLMAELGVLAAAIPEGADPERLAALRLPPDPVLRLAALLTGDPAAFAARLRLSNADRDRLLALRSGPAPQEGDDDAALRRMLADEDAGVLAGRVRLAGGPEALCDRLQAIPRPVFPLEGRHALALGVPPGPRVGELLRAVRAWWTQGGCVADAQACAAELAARVR
jgi:poly(A) polymerase/tRNA nucleotidyltransferase (CCA-adding enzyme)